MEGHPLHRRDFLLHLQARPGYDQPVLLKEATHQPPTRYLVILPIAALALLIGLRFRISQAQRQRDSVPRPPVPRKVNYYHQKWWF